MLEQIAYQLPRIQTDKQIVYHARNLENLSATTLHYGEGGGSSGFVGGGFGGISKKDMDEFGIVKIPSMKVTGNKIVIPYSNGLHDTFRYDRYGNLDEGHTTVNLPNGGKIRINTDLLKARKDNSFDKK